jgi:hypothetical protein
MMKRMVLGATLAALALSCLAPVPAPAVEQGPYQMEVLVDGVPLREHQARGRMYVEALRGKEYSLRLSNRTGERVAVALAVDGLNTIDAERTTARQASKWILGPWETITIDGWQTSRRSARRFFFTTEEGSYGAWLGKTEDLGVITAAFFGEKRPRPAPYTGRSSRRGDCPGCESRMERVPQRSDRSLGEAASAPAREAPPAAGCIAPPEDEYAATGIGRRVSHKVRWVEFEAEDRPAAVMEVRYEFRDALVRLGVLPARPDPDRLWRRERAGGFEDSPFAPDPYRR